MLEVRAGASYLDADFVTMVAWLRPTAYDTSADRGIIINKEASYEMGLLDDQGLLQAAFHSGTFTGGHLEGGGNHGGDWINDGNSYGCWRWWGHFAVPVHEWTHTVVSYDGTVERHYINGDLAETGQCPGDPSQGKKLDKHPGNRLKIGARGSYDCHSDDPTNCVPTPGAESYSQFRGDIDEVMVFTANEPSEVLSGDDVHYIFSTADRASANPGGGH
jgi:hypothetical protein